MSFFRGPSARKGQSLIKYPRTLSLLTVLSLFLVACGGNQATPAQQSTPADSAAATTAQPVEDGVLTTESDVNGQSEATAAPEQTPSSPAPEGTPSTQQLDRSQPAAVVNGEPITFEELDVLLERQYGSQLIDQLIIEKLIAQEAEKRNVTATEEEITAELERARGSLQPGQDFDQAVAQQFGSVEAFRNQLRLNVLLQKMLAPQIKLDDAHLQQYYNENKQQFATPEELHVLRVVTDVRAKAAAAAQELKNGAKLETVIEKHGSKQAGRAEQNADLGFVQVQTLSPEIAVAASSLEAGGVSEPIELQEGGFAVLKVQEKRGGEAPPLAEVKDRVRDAARSAAIQELAPQFLTELRTKAEIDSQFQLSEPQQPAAEPPAPEQTPAEPQPELTPQG